MAERGGRRALPTGRHCFGRYAPELLPSDFGPEIWDLYQRGMLHPDVVLTGRFGRSTAAVDLGSVLREIDDARAEEAARRLRLQAVA